MAKTLFEEDEIPKKKKRNPYHGNTGKFAPKLVAEKEQAQREAIGSRNRCDYLTSVISGLRIQLRQKDEYIIKIKTIN
jgi:hypothetical protein